MLSTRLWSRRMSHLATKFIGNGSVHVVDPQVDLKHLFENMEEMKRSLEERRIKVNLEELQTKYAAWWAKYETYCSHSKASDREGYKAAKKELRGAKDALIAALELPNSVENVGQTEKSMLKPSRHAAYLCEQGLMRIDKENEVCHLVGFPVALRNNISEQLMELFPEAQLLRPSSFVRAAVLEAVNVPIKGYVKFTDGSDSFPDTYLVGNAISTMLSSFIRTHFSDKNTWPITLQSVGPSYHAKRGTTDLAYGRQRTKHTVLSMGKDQTQVDEFIAHTTCNIGALLAEGLCFEVKPRVVLGKELKNYESEAIVFEERGLELARISRVGDYISRRLNVVSDGGPVQMTFVETDIDRIVARMVDDLVDGREIPKMLSNIIQQNK